MTDRLLAPDRTLRAVGFDDAPFPQRRGAPVSVAGVVCAGTRFESLLWTRVRKDGLDATRKLLACLQGSRVLPQLHLVLIDGVAFGGLNLLDLPRLHQGLELPVVAVMRRRPDLPAMRQAIHRLPGAARRLRLLERAGEIHEAGPFVFQAHGLSPGAAADALGRLTDRGKVPEPLRLAHLIGSAVMLGESRGGA